jgi:hypothetical protein
MKFSILAYFSFIREKNQKGRKIKLKKKRRRRRSGLDRLKNDHFG